VSHRTWEGSSLTYIAKYPQRRTCDAVMLDWGSHTSCDRSLESNPHHEKWNRRNSHSSGPPRSQRWRAWLDWRGHSLPAQPQRFGIQAVVAGVRDVCCTGRCQGVPSYPGTGQLKLPGIEGGYHCDFPDDNSKIICIQLWLGLDRKQMAPSTYLLRMWTIWDKVSSHLKVGEFLRDFKKGRSTEIHFEITSCKLQQSISQS